MMLNWSNVFRVFPVIFDHFSGPGRAIVPFCVGVYTLVVEQSAV